jgi:hypothetical protein
MARVEKMEPLGISGEVWRDDMNFIGKHGNQIAEHMKRRLEAVQEQNGRSISGTGFPDRRSPALHVTRAIENGRRNRV